MANYTFRQEITQGTYAGSNVGVAYNTSTSITDVSPGANTAGQALTIQPNQLQVGTHLHVVAKGTVSNTATPNLTLGVYYGAVAGTALCTTGAIATVSGLSNNSFHLEADIWVVTTGVSGDTTTFFSPSLYLIIRVWPSLPATVWATVALVMVELGRRS